MTKKTSYNFILVLAVISLLFFAPKGVFGATIIGQWNGGTTYSTSAFSDDVVAHYPNSYLCLNTTSNPVINSIAFKPVSGGSYYFVALPYASTNCTGGTIRYDYVELHSVTGGTTYTANASTQSSGTLANNAVIGVSHSDPTIHSIAFILANGLGGTPTFEGAASQPFMVVSSDLVPDTTGIPPTTDITAITPQLTDPFTQTATTTVSYYITAADLAAGTTTLSYVITTQDSIGYNPAQIGTIVATSSGSHTNTFYMGTGQAAWSAFYTLTGVAGEDPNIGAFYSIATSTFWVNGTSTLLNITTATSTGTTTNGLSLQQCKSTSLVDFSYFACVIGNRFSDVFQWLFIPPQGSLNEYQNMKTTVETKAPFGYFFLIKNAISGVNASSTSTFTLTLDQGVLAGIITPIRTALSWILLMGFGFWFYMRMKHLDIW